MNEIKNIDLGDGVSFEVKEISSIMASMEYPGIRVALNAIMGNLITPMKIDISTGDVITPHAIKYHYKLLLENRCIDLWSYNLETILAEKLQAVLQYHYQQVSQIIDCANKLRDFFRWRR